MNIEKNKKWLEIIELRTDRKDSSTIENQLVDLVDQICSSENSYKVYLYNNGVIENDFSIHLQHSVNMDNSYMSPLSERILQSLKEFGLVNHSLWIAKK